MSVFWLTEAADSEAGRSLVGGKAHHLFKLREWGASVPPFGVVTTESFHHWREHGRLPEGLLARIHRAIGNWSTPYFAVRSSMTAEDGSEASYAGVMETYLYVEAQDIEAKIIECFKSAFSERATDYHKRQGGSDMGAAVVVQAMVPSEVSGVAFSRAPIGNSALVYIEGGYGLGEGIVGGKVEVDGFWWDRFGEEAKRVIVEKKSRMIRSDSEREVVMGDVPSDLSLKPVLDRLLLGRLAKEVLRLEDRLGKPADIEWSVAGGELYILQVRPITQPFAPLGVFVDTNLSESYPGLTSPFTADFVARMYTKVFLEAAGILNFFSARVDYFRSSYESLIQNFEGHLYYRLNSYYMALSGLPGGKKNLEAWHKMIGGRIQSVRTPDVLPPGFLQSLATWVGILRLVVFHKSIFDSFLSESDASARKMESDLSESADSRVTARLLTAVMRDSKGWGLTALNDVLVMTGLKALTSLMKRHGALEEDVVALLRTSHGVDSLGPLSELEKICIDAGAGFADFVRAEILDPLTGADEPARPFERLTAAGFARESERLVSFLDRYGDRAFEELKLECMTFKQSPASFLRMVVWLCAGKENFGRTRLTKKAPPDVSHIRGLDGRLLSWLRGFTERTIQTRESTRLMRGKYFGWIRRAVLKLGEQLASENPALFSEFRREELFGLTVPSVQAHGEGADPREIHSVLLANRGWSSVKIEYPEFFSHVEGGGAETPYFLPEFAAGGSGAEVVTSTSDGAGGMSGTGASPGRIQGKALVLIDPRDALGRSDLRECILVTRSTDPAWIFIMSQCAGLVSEKGSLLSHTAIVGRELGIPTVVGVSGAVSNLKSGMKLEIDGSRGTISWVAEETV